MSLNCWQLILALIAAPVLVLVPAASAADLAKEQEAVRAADLGMAKAVADRDIEGFKAFVAADGVFIGSGLAEGPDQAAAVWTSFFDPESGMTLEWGPKEATVAASADLAYTIGAWTMRREVPDQEPQSGTGHYLTVWRKNDQGRWQVVADGSLVARDPLPPGFGLDPLRGLAARFSPLASPEAAVTHERQPKAVGIAAAGDLAYAFGQYLVRGTDAAGKTESATGAYFTVWTKEGDGPWKAVAESMNPPRPPEPKEEK